MDNLVCERAFGVSLLSIKQVAKYLGVSEKTVYRLVKKGEIPAIKVGNQWRFNQQEIDGWLRLERPEAYVAEHFDEFLPESDSPLLIYSLLKKDGMFFGIPGKTREESLLNAIKVIKLDSQINRDELLSALIDRERLCSTGIGQAIALPHPRHPHEFKFTCSRMFLFFLENKVDFEAIDNLPVDKLFFIFARNIIEHLHILSALTRLFHEKEFRQLLETSINPWEVLENIKQIEGNLALKVLSNHVK